MVPDKVWPFYPPNEEEPAGSSVVSAYDQENGERAASIEPSISPRPPFKPASQLTLESLENPFKNSQPAPIHWAVGWADLMMTMFILFLVLYLYPSTKEKQSLRSEPQYQDVSAVAMAKNLAQSGKGLIEFPTLAIEPAEVLPEPNGLDMAKLYDLIKLSRDDEEFSRFAAIDLSPDRTVRIILADDLLFPTNKADIRLIAKKNINKISALLQEIPHRISVVGHSDDQLIRGGEFATNWELSAMRAIAVARFLIEEMGVSASRITVVGKSFYQPQVSNSTPANRAKNRRVEIIVSLDPPPTLPLAKSNILPKTGGM
jgi:chemotaxis protein MotB